LDPLTLAKLAAVLIVLFAGMNLHQALAGYEGVEERIREYGLVAQKREHAFGVLFTRFLVYLGLPLAFLVCQQQAGMPGMILWVLGIKFGISAGLGIFAERRVVTGGDYPRSLHTALRSDSALNLAVAILAGYALYAWRIPLGI
jgi:hypothetical protein